MRMRQYAITLLLLILSACATRPDLGRLGKGSILVVLTHADDPIAIAPLVARYAAEGHAVYYALFTGMQNAALGREDSPERAELNCHARALGVQEAFVMAGPAGDGVDTIAPIATRLREWIEKVQPEVIVTWGPDGLTGHPRHILVGNIVTRVFQQQTHLRHRPRKLYYIAFPESRFPDSRIPTDGVANVNGPFGTVSDNFITTRVDGSAYSDKVASAIACHTLTFEPSASWQPAWRERIITTLGGVSSLRRVFPPATRNETDLFGD